MRAGLRPVVVLLLAGALTAAQAQSASDADALLRAGKYDAAISAGEAVGTGASLALAAEAALADATLRPAPCLACLKRAHALAQRSIEADPKLVRGYVWLTVAIGYEARIVGSFEARRAHYAEDAKAAADKALALAPGDAWSLAASGGWHLELVRAAGAFLARLAYGARVDSGAALFERALAADPGNATLQLNYALALSNVAFETKRGEIEKALAAAARAAPRDAYEAAMTRRAAELLAALGPGKDDAYRALARRYLGLPTDSPR